MSEWQLIETAPRYSDRVLVTDGKIVTIAWFNAEDSLWHDECDHDPFGNEMADNPPTHWGASA